MARPRGVAIRLPGGPALGADTARGDVAVIAAPLATGLLLPWVVFSCCGWIEPWSFGIAVVCLFRGYTLAVWRWSLRRRAPSARAAPARSNGGGRRGPSDQARAICAAGLAAALLLPCLSLCVLAHRVGAPRATGAVSSYDAPQMFRSGAALEITPVVPGVLRLLLLPGGRAYIEVPRFGRSVGFGTTWTAAPGVVCISGLCLTLDRASGRLSLPAASPVPVGRIVSVGWPSPGDPLPDPEQLGMPWELSGESLLSG